MAADPASPSDDTAVVCKLTLQYAVPPGSAVVSKPALQHAVSPSLMLYQGLGITMPTRSAGPSPTQRFHSACPPSAHAVEKSSGVPKAVQSISPSDEYHLAPRPRRSASAQTLSCYAENQSSPKAVDSGNLEQGVTDQTRTTSPPVSTGRRHRQISISSLHRQLMPRPSFTRLSSLHNLINYRAEKAIWERRSSVVHQSRPESTSSTGDQADMVVGVKQDDGSLGPTCAASPEGSSSHGLGTPLSQWPSALKVQHNKFRHLAAEVGFCFTICMTQLLSEYLVSGFAIELSRLVSKHGIGTGKTGLFWPASLLTLSLSAALLFSARVSDKFGGYVPFMCGIAWLAIWTAIPGQADSPALLNVSRTMQGLSIAALTPATFAMIGSAYREGRRRRLVLGLYSACAPMGFFVGLVAGSAIEKPQWYFWIAAILSSLTFITGFLTVPSDGTDRRELGLKMDWVGAVLTAAGLVAMSYGLSVAPYAGEDKHDWSSPMVIAPLAAGGIILILACWYETRWSHCPLLPLDFFKPRSVASFSMACLFFYASFGVWLYESAEYFNHPATTRGAMTGTTMALWYAPAAVGGLVLCAVSGWVTSVVSMMALVLASGLAWIVAPLLLALAPVPVSYWPWIFPSMLCATLGIDLTYTVSIIFISESQPLRYQGLAGAVCSILVNLAISFALSISEIVSVGAKEASHQAADPKRLAVVGYRAAFYYGTASAAVGFAICVLCVRLPGLNTRRHDTGEEGSRPSLSQDSLMARIVVACAKRHEAQDAR